MQRYLLQILTIFPSHSQPIPEMDRETLRRERREAKVRAKEELRQEREEFQQVVIEPPEILEVEQPDKVAEKIVSEINKPEQKPKREKVKVGCLDKGTLWLILGLYDFILFISFSLSNYFGNLGNQVYLVFRIMLV